MRYGSLFAAVVLVAATSLWAGDPPKLPFTVSKETTGITSPLRADGTPDYVAALNEKYGKGVTPENNGFVDVVNIVGVEKAFGHRRSGEADKILALAHAKPQSDFGPFLRYEEFLFSKEPTDAQRDAAADEMAVMGRTLWSQKEHPDLAAYLAAHAKHLDAVVKASTKTTWWIPIVVGEDGSMVGTLLSGWPMGDLWSVVDALRCRATLKAGSGDMDGAFGDLLAVKRLARLMTSGSSLYERAPGFSFNIGANESLGAILGSGKASPAQCAALAAELKRLAPMGSVVEVIDIAERWTELDMMIAIATGRLGAASGFEGVAGEKMDWNKALRMTNDWMDQQVAAVKPASFKEVHSLVAALDKQYQAWQVAPIKVAQELVHRPEETFDAHTQRAAQLLLGALFSPGADAEELSRRTRLEDAMLDLMVAAATVKAKTGQWPETLQGITPDAKLPQDLYPVNAPGPLKYVITPNGVRIYSVGKNERDDGGISDSEKDLDGIVVGVRR